MLRGYVAPLGVAGVKVFSDYVDNYKHGLRSEMSLLNLFDPKTGTPVAVIDASDITDMRTGAVTAIGAKHLARNCKQQGTAPHRTHRLAPRGGTRRKRWHPFNIEFGARCRSGACDS